MPNSRFHSTAARLLAAACVASSACSSDTSRGTAGTLQQGVTTGAGVVIEFRTQADPPATGTGIYEVTVRQNGTPVDDAVVEVRFSMPPMPSMNMPEMHHDSTFTALGGGRYRGTGRISMAGTWNVLISVSRGTKQIGTSRLSIVTKS